MKRRFLAITILVVGAFGLTVSAQEGGNAPLVPASAPVPAPAPGPESSAAAPAPMLVPTQADSASSSLPRKKPAPPKGKRSREKETDGTEAADRFKADTVIQSKYQFNGHTLEVDPD